ncbi:MAG: hypothetical protein UT24_C0046G0009 [Candidatus Woesebacteria bacterium GW2011_GWB1_39_12]|uniref:Uncharacterized protein n=1 Tax=Candidatus Woesebacteria bacterium GW2011_GWB1_39_12 TaxID=1618574 RepID=A0A0G0M2Q1_9BACT|nr:MAG: hypothetical protein UT24_C0046G0009 [Candidatus Woesebacteria bacterium GW2011_GWB1_39_12]
MSAVKDFFKHELNKILNESVIFFKTIGNGKLEFLKDQTHLLGTLDIKGVCETEGQPEFKDLSTGLKRMKIPFKTEETYGGSPNIILTQNNVKKLLMTLISKKRTA